LHFSYPLSRGQKLAASGGRGICLPTSMKKKSPRSVFPLRDQMLWLLRGRGDNDVGGGLPSRAALAQILDPSSAFIDHEEQHRNGVLKG
jgi:hypothetical protein